MASRHRIAETINESRMGDVEKFFDELSAVIETNSGTHDFKIISSDCHAQSAPLPERDAHACFRFTTRF